MKTNYKENLKFETLKKSLSGDFIKSLPVLTKLDLTANEIKIIELVLSFEEKGLKFYMNHRQIADYLVITDSKFKAKVVGNIIRSLKHKGYVSTITSANFNGIKGGSSTSITVNREFLEKQLQKYFNSTDEEKRIVGTDIVLVKKEENIHEELRSNEIDSRNINNLQDIIKSISLSKSPQHFFNEVKTKLKKLNIDDNRFNTISDLLTKGNILTMEDIRFKEKSLRNIVNSLDYFSPKEGRYVKLILLSE